MTAPPAAGPSTGTPPPDMTTVRAGLGDLVRRLHDLATAAELGHVMSPLVTECSRPVGGPTRVVVAGAANRGKSALVNALLGRPDLVPVDTDVATGVHVAIRHGERERAVVHRSGVEPLEIGIAEIARYASERLNPGNAAGVLVVEVEIPAPVLAGGLELVDTPGVDSVVARHADVTLAALGLADALVLVLDPSRPLTTPELVFLRRATRRLGTVVFALTRIDEHREWRRVLDDDRALVAENAPRFAGAPFLAVSGRLKTVADRARAGGRDALADRVEAESNVAALAAELDRVGGDVERVRLGNVVQLALVVLARLRSALTAARPCRRPGPRGAGRGRSRAPAPRRRRRRAVASGARARVPSAAARSRDPARGLGDAGRLGDGRLVGELAPPSAPTPWAASSTTPSAPSGSRPRASCATASNRSSGR